MADLATDAIAMISTVETSILAVGAAVVLLAAVAMGIRWVKATFF